MIAQMPLGIVSGLSKQADQTDQPLALRTILFPSHALHSNKPIQPCKGNQFGLRQKPQGAYQGIGETPTVACLENQAMCGSNDPNNKNLHGSDSDHRS
jgi:hypothetical protein